MTMKLRLAKKIVKAVGTPRESAYTQRQINAALERLEGTRESREANECWNAMMEYLGPLGRADILRDSFHAPADAFALLMRTPEEEWVGHGGRKDCAPRIPVPPQAHRRI